MVAAGRFREDLLDRLAFDVITLPPLRERTEDILPLAYAFAMNMISELELPLFPGFSARASSSLLRHDWPGNVRELKNAVERSVYRLEDPEQKISQIAFDPFDSPFRLRESAGHSAGVAAADATGAAGAAAAAGTLAGPAAGAPAPWRWNSTLPTGTTSPA